MKKPMISGAVSRTCGFFLKYLSALFFMAYVFLGGFILRANRDLLCTIIEHFKERHREKSCVPLIIPEVKIEQVLKTDHPIRILEPVSAKGNVSLLELCCINQLIREFNPCRLFEIGTFDGRTALNIAANSRAEAVVYTLDLPREKMNSTALTLDERDLCLVDKERPGTRYSGYPESKKIVQLFGDTAAFDFRPYYGSMDFIFIDGSHAYDYALNDTKVALKLLNKGKGVILWHDYMGPFDGVRKALNGFYGKEESFKGMRYIGNTTLAILIST